ncbi:MAG: hypothetical protein SOY02_06330 [Candidatus Onthovivens sp.]|nr:hypothetical protein [Candidatus Onthovivens sp.]
MVEVKLIGQIPVKQNSANSDKFVVNGASIYEAQNGDKYVFLSLKNPQKSPIFGFSLNIRQYDAAGAFIKESRYFDTQTYCGREQTYVLENPISVEKECEALEIAVVSVITFEGKIHKSEISIPTSEEMKLAKINASIIKEEKKVEAKEEVVSKEENVTPVEETKAEKVASVEETKAEDIYDENEDDELDETPKNHVVSLDGNTYKTIPILPQVLGALIAVGLLIFIFLVIAAIANSYLEYAGYDDFKGFFPDFWFGK